MKSKKIVPGLFLTMLTATAVQAQISAFTYQGQLSLNGAPANGHYDFMFRLLNEPTDGVAAPVIPINLAVTVSNGLFTTAMDFGVENFQGANRWLEINVRTNGGGAFTTLSPRQLLTPTPYAITANTASNLLGALPAGQISGTIPNASLSANVALLNAAQTFSADKSFGPFAQIFADPGIEPAPGYSFASDANTGIFLPAANTIAVTTGGGEKLRVSGIGNVGIGTTNPVEKLDVAGRIRAQSVQLTNGAASGRMLVSSATGLGSWSDTIRVFGLGVGIGLGTNNINASALHVAGGLSGFDTVFSPTAMIEDSDTVSLSLRSSSVSSSSHDIHFDRPIGVAGARISLDSSSLFKIGRQTYNAINSSSTLYHLFLNLTNGNFGIGAPNPVAELDVDGRVVIEGNVTPVATSSSNLLNLLVGGGTSSVATNGSLNGISFYESASSKAMSLGYDGSGSSSLNALRVYNSSDVALFTFEASGDLGIGTTTPSERLHVIGDILATGTITPNSDRNAKTDIEVINAKDILEKVAGMPVAQWRFKAEGVGVRHIGPMAQDFHAAFGLGERETAISTVDADGVALAAIQGLNQKTEEREAALRSELRDSQSEIAELKRELDKLRLLLDTIAKAKD